jgi:hypothetical protein
MTEKLLITKFSQQLVLHIMSQHQPQQEQHLLQPQLKLWDLVPLKSRILFVALKTNQICHSVKDLMRLSKNAK